MAEVEYIDEEQNTGSVIKCILKGSLRSGVTKQNYTEYINSRDKSRQDISVVAER
jgi:hypothetical protein